MARHKACTIFLVGACTLPFIQTSKWSRAPLWFQSPGVSMKPFPGCRYLIGVKPRKRSLKPVKASNKGDQEFLMQLML